MARISDVQAVQEEKNKVTSLGLRLVVKRGMIQSLHPFKEKGRKGGGSLYFLQGPKGSDQMPLNLPSRRAADGQAWREPPMWNLATENGLPSRSTKS